ncbi:glutathione S-transferase [Roseateles sp. YR242]|uniref:glutathione S-transferase family protein n=1 Tax=Roseateles sp. YR242 TaxID=1855305 RepID=UPI0008B5FE08|nr:glutathione S-transferase family protein [Roseateles sp. YR242]SEL82799.1 glutathione S-transferase [Roseateles sp. YR242]
MSLSLHYHPLSSFCHKALIALYELDVPFVPRFLDLGNAQRRADFLALWPTGKMPLLQDNDLVIPETSIIIEYLATRHAAASQTLIPAEAASALEVRLMDRLCDLYVMLPMQAIVADRLREEKDRDPIATGRGRDTLAMAYGMLDERLQGRAWLAGDQFTMADCAAAPALFYASTLVPFAANQQRLNTYYKQLLQRPSVARTLDEARPYFKFYPYREALPAAYQPQD